MKKGRNKGKDALNKIVTRTKESYKYEKVK